MAEEKKTNEILIRKALGKKSENLSKKEMVLLDGFSDFMVEMFIDYLRKNKNKGEI